MLSLEASQFANQAYLAKSHIVFEAGVCLFWALLQEEVFSRKFLMRA